MPRSNGDREWRDSPARRGYAALAAALSTTTVFGRRRAPDRLGGWVVLYPAVGLAIGASMLAADRLCSPLGGMSFGSAAALATAIALTGGSGFSALARSLASVLPDSTRPALQRVHDVPGAVVLVLSTALAVLELFCLLHLDRFRSIGMLSAPMLAHCAMVVLAVGSRAARMDGKQVKFAPAVTFNEFALASAATFAVVFLAADFLGLLLVLATAALTVALRVIFHLRLGGVDSLSLHAGAQATEIVVLAILAAF